MRLVIFTPALRASAIGRMTRLVVRALLGAGHDITVVRTESSDSSSRETLDFGVQIFNWTNTAEVQSIIARSDVTIYQIGDNFSYHAGGVFWLGRQRGIVCLHDFFLGHLFHGWAKGNPQHGQSVLRHWYGDKVAQSYFRCASSADFIDATHRTAPMTEWIASQASAVISHSGWGMHRVLSACPGPVRIVPLAYEAAHADISPSPSLTQDNGRMQILTVGHINPNKRVECVIRTLGSDERLRDGATYTLAGAIQPEIRRRLEEMASTLNVDLRICGEVSDAELRRLLDLADVVCCLRNPTLEAASASTIEAMLCGRSVVVEDTGFYAELPDDCVCKIRPEHEGDDLREVLLALSRDPNSRKMMGDRAALWARKTFSAENYARQLVELVPVSQRSMLISETMQVYASQLEQWGGAEALLVMNETMLPLSIFDSGIADEQSLSD